MITVHVVVNAPIEKVWECWTAPEHITGWAFASDDWEARDPENEMKVGGRLKTTMAAKDGSESFEFAGTYTTIDEYRFIGLKLDDGRNVTVKFEETPDGVKVVESFEAEEENPEEMQRAGWQAILDNFKKYVESR